MSVHHAAKNVSGGSMPGRRPEKVAERIKEEVSQIIAGDLKDPRVGFVTVTDARVSPDLRHARIYISVMGSDQDIESSLAALRSASGYIRHELGRSLHLMRTPELHFEFDQTAMSAARIEEILKEESEKLRAQEESPAPDSQILE